MNYTILGDSDCPLVQIDLADGEKVMIERGAMAYSCDVAIEGKLNTNKSGIGGLLSAIGRSLTSGESVFITEATGQRDGSFIGIAPAIPGKIVCLDVGAGHQYNLNTAAFLACDEGVSYEMKSQDIGKALFAGTGGLFIMETTGNGQLLVSAFGDILELEVRDEQPLTVDNEHVVAWDAGLDIKVYADETRPRLQGARLTAWELTEAGIPVTLIPDSAAATLIREGKIDLIVLGADRITANGDVANKLGTFPLSIVAKEYGVPFYSAAPTSTIDFSMNDGKDIPIEERDPDEVRMIDGVQIAPKDVPVFNPSFDVTPHQNITGIITEKGIIRPPFDRNIERIRQGETL